MSNETGDKESDASNPQEQKARYSRHMPHVRDEALSHRKSVALSGLFYTLSIAQTASTSLSGRRALDPLVRRH